MGTSNFGWKTWAEAAHNDRLTKPFIYQRCPYCDKKILGTKAARKHRSNCTHKFKAQLTFPEGFSPELTFGDVVEVTIWKCKINRPSIRQSYRIGRTRKQDNKIIYEIIK